MHTAEDYRQMVADFAEAYETMRQERQAKLNELQGMIETMAHELGHAAAERNCSRAFDILHELSLEQVQ